MTAPQVGDRVRVLRWAVDKVGTTDPATGLIRDANGTVLTVDDNVTVPPGTEGTVTHVSTSPWFGTQIGVEWDNGSRLSLLDEDQWKPVSR